MFDGALLKHVGFLFVWYFLSHICWVLIWYFCDICLILASVHLVGTKVSPPGKILLVCVLSPVLLSNCWCQYYFWKHLFGHTICFQNILGRNNFGHTIFTTSLQGKRKRISQPQPYPNPDPHPFQKPFISKSPQDLVISNHCCNAVP